MARDGAGSSARLRDAYAPSWATAEAIVWPANAPSARQSLTFAQAGAIALAAFGLDLGVAVRQGQALGLLHMGLLVVFFIACALRLAALMLARSQPPAYALADCDLPIYTLIVPLYREAAVVPTLIEALSAIDYPRDRLQAIIAIEADDAETRRALIALPLPSFIEVLAVPPGSPRTKPRACNVALGRARGSLVAVFDAEDRPHRLQLREAAARFAVASPTIACLQAPLHVDRTPGFLAAQFALEYLVQFRVILPALAAIGAPFPLGGTSNHFRIGALRAVGAWDAWNVTEDADLGFRLAAFGYGSGVLTAPTYEPPPRRLSQWLPQRARWIKGHMQTFAVHTRRIGSRSLGFNLALAGTLGLSILSSLAHGPLAAWLAADLMLAFLSGGRGPATLDVLLLLAGFNVSVWTVLRGLERAGNDGPSLAHVLLSPLYWPLQSLAAWAALAQLALAPYRWDKTDHTPEAGRIAA